MPRVEEIGLCWHDGGYEAYRGKTNPTGKGKTRKKAELILALKRNNPDLTASEIATIVGTTENYVYKVLSKGKVERWGLNRSESDNRVVGVHGLWFYEDVVLREWYEVLDAPVVNRRTGMKQVGFKERGDPCACQIHKNGRVVVYAFRPGWKRWLREELVRRGWKEGWADLLVSGLRFEAKTIEAHTRVEGGWLNNKFILKTAFGVFVLRDDSPERNTLELKLSVPDLSKFLGLPEIQKRIEVLERGSVTTLQNLKTLTALLVKMSYDLEEIKQLLKEFLGTYLS